MQSVVQMSRSLAAAGLRVSDMVAHCGFVWSFMFEVLAPHNHPAGRIIMITDMSGIKLGQAVGEGQVSCCTAQLKSLLHPKPLLGTSVVKARGDIHQTGRLQSVTIAFCRSIVSSWCFRHALCASHAKRTSHISAS
jgi:hypothetical protein